MQDTFFSNSIKSNLSIDLLLNDFRDLTGTNSSSSFANREFQTGVDGYRCNKLNGNR